MIIKCSPEALDTTHVTHQVPLDKMAAALTPETFDVYDQDGILRVTKCDPEIVHQKELWHAGILILIESPNGQFLLQRRAGHKIMGGLWDFSCAGHLHSGESQTEAMIRELHEELSLDLTSDNVSGVQVDFLRTTMEEVPLTKDLVHREIQHNIRLKLNDVLLSKLQHNPDEVAEIKWCTKEELMCIVEDMLEISNDMIASVLLPRKQAWSAMLDSLSLSKTSEQDMHDLELEFEEFHLAPEKVAL